METNSEPRILDAERFDGGVLIGFDNGRVALYSAALLYTMFHQAVEIDESITIDED